MIYDWGRNYSIGDAHEDAVAARLLERGWEVQRWRLLDPVPGKISVIRLALQAMEGRHPLRDFPDLLAAKQTLGGHKICWIEVKNCSERNAERPTVTITSEQFKNQCEIEQFTRIPLYHVFNDFAVADTETIKQDAWEANVVGYRGDQFHFMCRTSCVPFDQVFGRVAMLAQTGSVQ